MNALKNMDAAKAILSKNKVPIPKVTASADSNIESRQTSKQMETANEVQGPSSSVVEPATCKCPGILIRFHAISF